VDGHVGDAHLQEVLGELQKCCTLVKILGTFPVPSLTQ
jgi:prephenate dehydratase